jgi:signal transduction histidine kinase
MDVTPKELIELANPYLYALLFDNLSINYSIIDCNGNYLHCNDSNLQNISQGLTNAKDIDPVTWLDCEKVMHEKKQAIKEEFFREKLFLSIKQPIIKDNESVGIIVLSIDITEKRQAEIAKKEFIENMSHDLRTPFTGIISLSEYLYNQEQESTKKELLGEILNSGKSLLSLLNQVLELSKQGSHPLNITEFNLAEVIQESLNLVHAEAVHKKLVISTHFSDLSIKSDRMRISRILINLLSNAIKYTSKGYISVKLKRSCPIEIDIEDTGEGIPTEALSYIFERFSKLNSSYQQKYFDGAGIGLHIAREFARELGGDITVKSEVGKGSRFTLLLKNPST